MGALGQSLLEQHTTWIESKIDTRLLAIVSTVWCGISCTSARSSVVKFHPLNQIKSLINKTKTKKHCCPNLVLCKVCCQAIRNWECSWNLKKGKSFLMTNCCQMWIITTLLSSGQRWGSSCVSVAADQSVAPKISHGSVKLTPIYSLKRDTFLNMTRVMLLKILCS